MTSAGRWSCDSRRRAIDQPAAAVATMAATPPSAKPARGPNCWETHPTIGRATVYRALEQQVEDRMASRFERDGHVSAYIACDAEHHHHLVCTNCQRVDDVAEDVVAPMLASVGRRHDFAVDHAALDFYGLCARCRSRRR